MIMLILICIHFTFWYGELSCFFSPLASYKMQLLNSLGSSTVFLCGAEKYVIHRAILIDLRMRGKEGEEGCAVARILEINHKTTPTYLKSGIT